MQAPFIFSIISHSLYRHIYSESTATRLLTILIKVIRGPFLALTNLIQAQIVHQTHKPRLVVRSHQRSCVSPRTKRTSRLRGIESCLTLRLFDDGSKDGIISRWTASAAAAAWWSRFAMDMAKGLCCLISGINDESGLGITRPWRRNGESLVIRPIRDHWTTAHRGRKISGEICARITWWTARRSAWMICARTIDLSSSLQSSKDSRSRSHGRWFVWRRRRKRSARVDKRLKARRCWTECWNARRKNWIRRVARWNLASLVVWPTTTELLLFELVD
jgi:hypothetical protein